MPPNISLIINSPPNSRRWNLKLVHCQTLKAVELDNSDNLSGSRKFNKGRDFWERWALLDLDLLHAVYPSSGWYPAESRTGIPRDEIIGITERPFGPEVAGLNLFKRASLVRCHLDENAQMFWLKQRAIHNLINPFPLVPAVGGPLRAIEYPPDAVWVQTNHPMTACLGAAEIEVDQYITNSSSKKNLRGLEAI